MPFWSLKLLLARVKEPSNQEINTHFDFRSFSKTKQNNKNKKLFKGNIVDNWKINSLLLPNNILKLLYFCVKFKVCFYFCNLITHLKKQLNFPFVLENV